MFVYFVAYQVPNGRLPILGNIEILRRDAIDSYVKVTEVEQAISDHLRGRGIDGPPIVTNWILLREQADDSGEAPDVVHLIRDGSATTACCYRTPFELPRAGGHRLTQA